MHQRVQRRTESWGAVVVDKPPDPPAEREPGRVQAAAQSDGVTVTSQAVAERWMHRRVQRRTESWGAVVVDKPPDSPAERERHEMAANRSHHGPWRSDGCISARRRPCEYHGLIGYGHDPTFACECCAANCAKTATLDCSGNAFERVHDGCELRLAASNRTLDEQALVFLASHIESLALT